MQYLIELHESSYLSGGLYQTLLHVTTSYDFSVNSNLTKQKGQKKKKNFLSDTLCRQNLLFLKKNFQDSLFLSNLTMFIKPMFSYAIRHFSSSMQQLNNYKRRSWARKLLVNAELSRFYSKKKALNGKELKSAVIVFANGAEEMEVVIPADVLRRAKVG